MKLFELTGHKKLVGMDAEKLIQVLLDKGAFKKVLGHGSYGIAFELPKGDVLKCWGDDPSYEEWIEYCVKNKSNPYLPKTNGKIKTFDVKNLSGHSFPISYIRMEKLEPVTSLKDFGYGGEFFSEKKAANRFLVNLEDMITGEYGKDFPNPTKLNKKFYEFSGLEIEKSTPKFEQFIKMTVKIMKHIMTKGKGFSRPDLALRNFGKRGDQIVILDPLGDVGSGHEIVLVKDFVKNVKDLIES